MDSGQGHFLTSHSVNSSMIIFKMQLQQISPIQRQGILLNESLLEDKETISKRSSIQQTASKPHPQLSPLTPPKIAKQRFKKNEATNKAESIRASDITRLEQPQQFRITKEKKQNFVYNKYDIWDLTYSLINAKIDKRILMVLFIIQISVRYFSILSLVYITIRTYSEQWQWIFILIFTNSLYFICIVKISLKPAETQSQFILKQSFQSLEENEASDYFRAISPRKLLISLARGLVPPQFSCFYIRDSERRVEIYAMINFIYSSIEAVIYYPFFLIYLAVIIKVDKEIGSLVMFYISLGLIAIFQCIFIVTSLYLVVFGCKKKGYLKRNKNI